MILSLSLPTYLPTHHSMCLTLILRIYSVHFVCVCVVYGASSYVYVLHFPELEGKVEKQPSKNAHSMSCVHVENSQ